MLEALYRAAIGAGLAGLIMAPLVVHAVWCAWLKAGCSPLRRDWWSS